MKKGICLWLLVGLCCAQAGALPELGALNGKSAALYDANGTMLYENNAEQPLQPASVTKIMTMLLLMEAVDAGQVAMDDLITGSAYAESMGGTQVWLKTGEQMTVSDMLKAVAVGSANDCAVAIAEHLAGSEGAFVDKMNSRAQQLGCTNTVFVNANGLDAGADKTQTTARDLALISAELLKHPQILEYTTIWMDSIRDGAFALANTNKMLKSYDGMIGLKTGYISQAGYCIAAAAEREGFTLIATVMAAPTSEARTADVTTLLNYGYANFTPYTPDLQGQLEPIAVDMGKTAYVGVTVGDLPTLTVEKETVDAITTQIDLPARCTAPIVQGQALGSVQILQNGQTLATLPLCAESAVARLGYRDILHRLTSALLMKAGG